MNRQLLQYFVLGSVALVGLLVGGGCNTTPPVHAALQQGKIDRALELIGENKGIHDRDRSGQTALHLAAELGHFPVAKALVEKGAHVNAQSSSKWTPLMDAAKSGHADIVDLLLAHQADPDLRSNQGATAMYLAAYAQHDRIVRALCQAGADPKIATNNGFTPLMAACIQKKDRARQVELVRLLLSRDCDPCHQSASRWTPLHCAAESNAVEVADVLIQAGADINAQGPDFQTPIHSAGGGGAADAVELLLQKGATLQVIQKRPGITGKTYRIAAQYHERNGNLAAAHRQYLVAAQQLEQAAVACRQSADRAQKEVEARRSRNFARGLVWLITPVNMPMPQGESTEAMENLKRKKLAESKTYDDLAEQCRKKLKELPAT